MISTKTTNMFFNSSPLPSPTSQTLPTIEAATTTPIPIPIAIADAIADIEQPPIRRRSTKRRVTFRDSKSHAKTLDPTDVFLVARSNSKATDQSKQIMDVEKITPQLISVLSQEQTLISHIEEILKSSNRAKTEQSVKYSISKTKNKVSLRSKNSVYAEYSIPFNTFKVISIIFPQKHSMLAMSSPTSHGHSQSFVHNGIEYCWRQNCKTMDTLVLTKTVTTANGRIEVVCAKYLVGKSKNNRGVMIVDGDKIDERLALVTVGVCKARMDSLRGKIAGILGKWCDCGNTNNGSDGEKEESVKRLRYLG